MRKCGNCGETGHNRRTCTQLEVIEEVEEDGYLEEEEVVVIKPKKKKKVIKCSDCGEEDDHTAKNCPYKPIPEGADIGPKLMECGHFDWWLEDGECVCCSRAIFSRNLQVAA